MDVRNVSTEELQLQKLAIIGDIGAAIQEYAESHGLQVVRDLVGHGVGPAMHEEPMAPLWPLQDAACACEENGF